MTDDRIFIDEGGIVSENINVNKNSSFVIVSYYWGKNNLNKNSPYGKTYGQQVDDLINSCVKVGCNYHIIEYPVFEKPGMYQRAINLKGYFIKKCLEKFNKVIYIDSDLLFMKYPYLFDVDADFYCINYMEHDISCYNPLEVWLPGGIMGFTNSRNSRIVLDLFVNKMLTKPELAEDKVLSSLITSEMLNEYIRCVFLPETYLYFFEEHEYDPDLKKYTKVATFKEEFKNSYYKQNEVTIVHTDLETASIGKQLLIERGIMKDRVPVDFYKVIGKKLRCLNLRFDLYRDFDLNTKQLNDYKVEIEEKESQKIIKICNLPERSKFKFKYNFDYDLFLNDKNNGELIVIFSKSKVKTEKYENKNILFVYTSTKNVNVPLFLYDVMKQVKKSVIVHSTKAKIPNFVRSFDIVTFNMNNNFKISKCKDPRILKMMNMDFLYIAYNELMMKFLLIWAKYNVHKCIEDSIQHKSLEYAFNISLMFNKLRCLWIKEPISSKNLNTYGSMKKYKNLEQKMVQCGIKPPLLDDSPEEDVYSSGTSGKNMHRIYNKLF
jgi:hypothetical protein